MNVLIGTVVGAVSLLAYCNDAFNYYQPRADATSVHDSLRFYVDQEIASTKGWSELEQIKAQIELLRLKVSRILDRAQLQGRALTDEERYEIDSYREEIRLLNDRKNAVLGRQSR